MQDILHLSPREEVLRALLDIWVANAVDHHDQSVDQESDDRETILLHS